MHAPSFLAAVAAALLGGSALVRPALAQPAPAPGAAPGAPSRSAPAPSPTRGATPPAASQPAAPQPAADPVLARVGGEEIRASDVAEAAQGLPEELRSMPAQVLQPMLLDQLIDRKVIVQAARKQGLDKDPQVQRQIARAADTALQNALLLREVGPSITEEALRARYQREFAGKPGEEEVRAHHILVADEEAAKRLIAELKGGADFEALAKQHSTDPSAKEGGGDLGFFKRADMLPEFADAAWALKPGDISQAPVKTRFGWHVIKLDERRQAAPPPFEQVRDELRQSMIQDGVRKVLDQAKTGVTVERFNPDGTPQAAVPSTPAPGTPAAGAAAPGQAPAR